MSLQEKLLRFAVVRFLWFIKLWYNLTVFLTRKPKTKINKYDTVRALGITMRGIAHKWRPDPLSGALDVCMHPSKFQRGINGESEELGDCDDYAMYWAACLKDSNLADEVYFAACHYINNDTGKIGGHAVCVFIDSEDGELYWADYGKPHQIKGIWEVADGISRKYNATPISVLYFDVDYTKETNTPHLRGGEVRLFDNN